MDGLTDPQRIGARGVPHADELIRFADALVKGTETELANARQALVDKLGPEHLVDAAGVASNFQRMVRIADTLGIPVDPAMQVLSEDIRAELGIDEYLSASNTQPVRGLRRWFAKVIVARLFRQMVRRAST